MFNNTRTPPSATLDHDIIEVDYNYDIYDPKRAADKTLSISYKAQKGNHEMISRNRSLRFKQMLFAELSKAEKQNDRDKAAFILSEIELYYGNMTKIDL